MFAAVEKYLEHKRGRANSERTPELEAERLSIVKGHFKDVRLSAITATAITLSLRGIMYAQIDVTGTPVDLHSGGFGGAVENPANALARIICELKAPDGRVRVRQ